jgi:hypothetical protein
VHGRRRHPGESRPPRPQTATERARLDFPMPLRPVPPLPSALGTDPPARRSPRPPHRPRAPAR